MKNWRIWTRDKRVQESSFYGTRKNRGLPIQKCEYLGYKNFYQKKRNDVTLCTSPRRTYPKISKIVSAVLEKKVWEIGKKKTTKTEKTVFFDFLDGGKV